jgi:hypothetical protein
LDVARAPIVEHDAAEDVLPRLVDRDRLAERVARTRDEAEFEFEIERRRRTEARFGAVCPSGRTIGVSLTTTVLERPW